jgi:hypothetical protein
MIDEVLAMALAPARAHRQLKALLLRADSDFVRCAFLTTARREPTATERSWALQRLAAGAPRTAILSELLAASARMSGRAGPRWLRDALRHERLVRLPLLRSLSRIPLNPLPWLVRLVIEQVVHANGKAAFVMLERVPARAPAAYVQGDGSAFDSIEPRVVDRIYRDLSAAMTAKGR